MFRLIALIRERSAASAPQLAAIRSLLLLQANRVEPVKLPRDTRRPLFFTGNVIHVYDRRRHAPRNPGISGCRVERGSWATRDADQRRVRLLVSPRVLPPRRE